MTTVALVGLGEAARGIWAPALASLPDLQVIAGADPESAARAAWGKLTPRASQHAALQDLLDDHRPDWLIVTSPPALHRDHVLAGLRRGCHVLCEKPIAQDVAGLDALEQAAKEAGRVIAVNHEFTRMPIFAACLDSIRARTHGALRFAQVWQLVQDPPSQSWRAGGENMREFGTHAIDLLLAAFGGPPSLVSARMPRPPGAGSGDPLDLVTLEWPDGRAAQLVLSRLSPGAHRYMEARFDCEAGSLRASIGGRASVQVGIDARARRPRLRLDLAGGGAAWIEQGERRRSLARNGMNALATATSSLFSQTLAAVKAGQPPPCGLEQARDVLSVIDAAYRSAATDTVVRL